MNRKSYLRPWINSMRHSGQGGVTPFHLRCSWVHAGAVVIFSSVTHFTLGKLLDGSRDSNAEENNRHFDEYWRLVME